MKSQLLLDIVVSPLASMIFLNVMFYVTCGLEAELKHDLVFKQYTSENQLKYACSSKRISVPQN